MIDTIIAFSIRNKIFIAFVTCVVAAWGAWSAAHIAIDAVPDITNNQVQIITVCPTLAGEEVEQLVTAPIERSLANLPGIEELRSVSRFGLSVVTVVFQEKVEVYFARQLVNEQLKEAESQIPKGVGTPELAPVSTGLGEVYQYVLRPKKGAETKYDPMELRTLQDWVVARQLMGTEGIAEVNSFGGSLKQYEVAVEPARLLSMGITIADIIHALERNNENTGGAYIEKKPNAFFIRGIGLIHTREDIQNISVKNNANGIPILVRDVATVKFGSAVRYGAMSYNGNEEVVGGVVMMFKGANSAEVVERINAKLPAVRTALPADVELEPFLDRTDLINHTTSTVATNLIEGALIVIFVLVLFLGNIRAGLIVASAIPLSMLFALGLMKVFGVSANLMSLGAIDFGLIVDGAVIIVEATIHRLTIRASSLRMSQAEMDREVFASASRIRKSAAFGEIIILIVYLPILSLSGVEGKMFAPMAQTVGFAIIGALLLSFTYIPMMCALFLPKTHLTKTTFSEKLIEKARKIYSPILEFALRFHRSVIAASALAFAGSILVFLSLGGEFLPSLQEGDYAFHCILPQGSSLSQSIESSMRASRVIKQFDEVRIVVCKTGSAEIPTDPMPPEATDMMILLKPKSEWKRSVTYDELADEILEKLEVIPGVFFEKNQPIQMRFNELMTGIRQDVAIKIFGEDTDTLLNYADKVAANIEGIEGVTAPMVERTEGLPQIAVKYNRAQLANYGVDVSDANLAVSAAFAGAKVGVVFENERRFDLVVRLDSTLRKSIDDVSSLYIPIKGGSQIPLDQIAEVTMQTGPAQISHESGKRRIVVGFNVKGRDVASIVEDIQIKLKNSVELPEGYYFTFGGSFENLQRASSSLIFTVPLSLALILTLLYLSFRSVSQTLLVFTAIPMSAIGGVLALVLRGMPFSISAGVGFIALFGVAVLNGIVLMSSLAQMEKNSIESVVDRIRSATMMRLRPVLMTAAVASLGFLPMAMSNGLGAEIQRPLATVVIGGLISSTAMTLIVLPALYFLVANRSSRKRGQSLSSVAVLLLLTCGSSSFAQISKEAITLSPDQAVAFAVKNNALIQSRELQRKAVTEMLGTSSSLPKLDFEFQYGQNNSVAVDNIFQVKQQIPFPTVFSARRDLLESDVAIAELDRLQTINTVRGEVLSLCYTALALKELLRLSLMIDSAYAKYVAAVELRLVSGSTTILEKVSAQAKYGALKQKRARWQTELESTLAMLGSTIGAETTIDVAGEGGFKPLQFSTDNAIDISDSTIQVRQMNTTIARATAETDLERAQLLPDFTVGYVNQSFNGVQNVNGVDKTFGASDRFSAVSIGLSLPLSQLFSSGRISASELKKQAITSESGYRRSQLQSMYGALLRQLRQHQTEYDYNGKTSIPNSFIILQTAQTSYTAGDISYVEFVQSLETVLEMTTSSIQTIDGINQTIVRLRTLLNLN